MIVDSLFQRFLDIRHEDDMALGQPLLDAGIMPVTIMAPSGKYGWFICASYPASAGLFEGIAHSEFADSAEDCVEKILEWYEKSWGGL